MNVYVLVLQVGPNWPTAEQKKQIRELRISACLNAVMCYIRTVDSDPDMAILKPKEAEMKQLMQRAIDQCNKVCRCIRTAYCTAAELPISI